MSPAEQFWRDVNLSLEAGLIFCRDILYVHVPKTGGMSVTRYLLQNLPRPIYYTIPDFDKSIADPGVVQIAGLRHESLPEAAAIARQFGFELSDFQVILGALRDPYAMEVSRFAYLQKGHSWDKGHNQRLAMEEDFETFAVQSIDHAGTERPIQSFFLVDGKMPPNMKVLKAENLAEELRAALVDVGIFPTGDLVRENTSSHLDPLLYYTPAAEEAVAKRYKWIFDNGFYPRLDASRFASNTDAPRTGPDVPVTGPVRQVGSSFGIWHDSWVGREMSFRVKTTCRIERMAIEASMPHAFVDELTVSVRINGAVHEKSLKATPFFRWEFPCNFEAGQIIHVRIAPASTFRPADLGKGQDTRELSIHIHKICFIEPAPSAVAVRV